MSFAAFAAAGFTMAATDDRIEKRVDARIRVTVASIADSLDREGVPHEPLVAEWLFFPHPTHRQGVLRRFAKKTPVTLHLPPRLTAAIGQAAVRFPMRSGDEVALSFTTQEELPR